jgi:hypothetical protein
MNRERYIAANANNGARYEFAFAELAQRYANDAAKRHPDKTYVVEKVGQAAYRIRVYAANDQFLGYL